MEFFGVRRFNGSLIDFSASKYFKFLKKTLLRMSGDELESITGLLVLFMLRRNKLLSLLLK